MVKMNIEATENVVTQGIRLEGNFNSMTEVKRANVVLENDGSLCLYNISSTSMSSLYSLLIKEAGRWCEAYASDVLMGINAIQEIIDDPLDFLNNYNESETFWFGFRQSGVDGESFIESNLQNYGKSVFKHYYRAIYVVTVVVKRHKDDGKYDYVTVEYGCQRLDDPALNDEEEE